jgi:hypothetical protein
MEKRGPEMQLLQVFEQEWRHYRHDVMHQLPRGGAGTAYLVLLRLSPKHAPDVVYQTRLELFIGRGRDRHLRVTIVDPLLQGKESLVVDQTVKYKKGLALLNALPETLPFEEKSDRAHQALKEVIEKIYGDLPDFIRELEAASPQPKARVRNR